MTGRARRQQRKRARAAAQREWHHIVDGMRANVDAIIALGCIPAISVRVHVRIFDALDRELPRPTS